MTIARLGRQAKRPHGFCVKVTAVAILGLCFIFMWSMFSSSSSSVVTQRESFDDIAEPVAKNTRASTSGTQSNKKEVVKHGLTKEDKKSKVESDLDKKDDKKVNGSVDSTVEEHKSEKKDEKEVANERKVKPTKGVAKENKGSEDSEGEDLKTEKEEQEEEVGGKEEGLVGEAEENEDKEGESDLIEPEDQESEDKLEDGSGESRKTGRKKKIKGGRLQSYRHRERSCPRTPVMCLVPLPRDGYESPVHWPESKLKIMHKNVAHPKLAAFVKKHSWVVESGKYLMFPQDQSEFKGGVVHYLESIEDMVPDIEWGKNVRVVLDVGCTDSSFSASLLDKEVLTLSLGLKDDLVDLAQVALERGFPAVVSPFATRRLPFPSAVVDTVHCGGCGLAWHSNGGKLLLEMNRILRPGGYFILSTTRDSIEAEEAMTRLTASIYWNILAYKTDEVSEVGFKIYQKPDSNDLYELRRKKNPPLCKENENPDAAWYVPIKTCLHTIPSAIEEHGTEWPEEWPKRLQTSPDWLNDKEKLIADTNHWKAIVDNSYLTGFGIDWSTIRNVLDMKAIYGGFAAALSQRKVWVMNVVPVHAPDTLPFIFERGLLGIYHDWCESFGTYPRTYDLLHADHLFSRLKNRCKQPVSIVVEMDRILRSGGWVIIRDKVEILDPLEGILRSLHWEIRMTYAQDKEGILCAQKKLWRP